MYRRIERRRGRDWPKFGVSTKTRGQINGDYLIFTSTPAAEKRSILVLDFSGTRVEIQIMPQREWQLGPSQSLPRLVDFNGAYLLTALP